MSIFTCGVTADPCSSRSASSASADIFGSTSSLPPAIPSDSLPPLPTLLARTHTRPLAKYSSSSSSSSASLNGFPSPSPILQRNMQDSTLLPSRSGSWSSVEAALPYIPTSARPDNVPVSVLSGRTARRSSNASSSFPFPHLPPLIPPSRPSSPLAGLRRSASSASLSDSQNWQSRGDLSPLESRRMSSIYDQELSSGMTSASSWSSTSDFGSPFSTPGHDDPSYNGYHHTMDSTPSKSFSSSHFSTPKAPGTNVYRSAFPSLSSASSTATVGRSSISRAGKASTPINFDPLPGNLFGSTSGMYDQVSTFDTHSLHYRPPSPSPTGLARSVMGSVSRPRDRSLNHYASSSGLSRYEGSGWH